MNTKITYKKVLIGLFVIIELVGFTGILWPRYFDLTVGLTQINLWFVLFVLLSFHKTWSTKETLWMGLVFLVGFFIEVLGVKTGKIFGTYWYGENLGFKIFDVPIAMGVNWLLLCYTSVRVVDRIKMPKAVKGVLAAAIMVLLDVIMEPVAMAFDFWQWQADIIPLQNYLAWFVVASLLNSIWYYLNIKSVNIFSNYVFLYLLLFFGVMHLKFG